MFTATVHALSAPLWPHGGRCRRAWWRRRGRRPVDRHWLLAAISSKLLSGMTPSCRDRDVEPDTARSHHSLLRISLDDSSLCAVPPQRAITTTAASSSSTAFHWHQVAHDGRSVGERLQRRRAEWPSRLIGLTRL